MFAGVAVMILMIPFNAVIASINKKLQVRNLYTSIATLGIFNCSLTEP